MGKHLNPLEKEFLIRKYKKSKSAIEDDGFLYSK